MLQSFLRMNSVWVALRLAVTLVLVGSVWGQHCPSGWFDRPNSNLCYMFTYADSTNTWPDSRLKCQAAGGDLVSIKSHQEWDFINQTIYKLYQKSNHRYLHWWIGLNKRSDKTTWTWIADHSPPDMSIVTWQQGAPTNDQKKNCVQIYKFGLTTDSCTSGTYQSICSRPKGLPLKCDNDGGWVNYNGFCYKWYDTARTWNDASKTCKTLGSTLPVITDATTDTIVADFSRQKATNIWTGLRSSGKPNAIQWTWPDGTVLGTNPFWMSKQPGNIASDRINNTCVELNHNAHLTSSWVTNTCGTKRKFYCQKPEGKCLDGWLQYGAVCYQFNPHYKMTWSQAKQQCVAQGGNLAVITNPNIQKLLNLHLNTQNKFGVSEVWIGITDQNKNGGAWYYSDGQTVSKYANWAGDHKNTPNKMDCGYITTSDRDGKWRVTTSCNSVRSFVCQIQANTPLKQVTQPPNHYICSDKWKNYGTNCFYANEQDMNWINARSWCKSNGGDLAKIPDAATQAFLSKLIHPHSDYWIGLSDQHREGWYTWLDETSNTTFTNWANHQPDNNGNVENCVHIFAPSGSNGKWNDNKCNAHLNFVCEKQAKNAYNTPPTTTPKPWGSKCGPFWTSDPFTPMCYQFNEEQLTYFDARARCIAHGGDLASIETSEESAYITGRIRTKHSADFWIGANDLGNEGGWKWADGRPFGFLNWLAGEPNDYGHREDCASMLASNGRWHDQYCNLRKGFVCKSAAYYTCSPGWINFKGACYKFQHAKKNWQDSRKFCKNLHGDLVKILTLDVLGFVRDHMDQSGDWWIGLNDIKTEKKFVWNDDKNPSGVIQWKRGEPNGYGDEDCVAILANTFGTQYYGQYNDFKCSTTHNFICATAAQTVKHTNLPQTSTPTVPTGSIFGCPLNWKGYRGSCYYFAWSTGSYDNSVAQCGYQGGKLASVIDGPENKFVFSIIPKSITQPGKAVWLGLNDRAVEMKYVWQDGVKVSYTNWALNEPNNWQGHDEDCVAMYTQNGFWVDRVCSDNLVGAVCKKPKSVIPKSQMEIGKGCQPGQIGYHTTCYSFQWNAKTWRDAEKDCVSHKGHLATIPDRHVQAFLGAEMVYRSSTWWVGLSDAQSPGQYQWSSGQPFNYVAWYETHTGNERKTCVGIRAGHPAGLWENHNCTDHRMYICEYPRVGYTTLPTTPTTTPSPLPCPTGWYEFKGVCYKLHINKQNLKTWTESRDVCRGYGGDLASIHNSTLEPFLASLQDPKLTKQPFWIGLNDRDTERSYQWSDGSPFTYSNWAFNEPNNYNQQEDCVLFNPISKNWNDFYCYSAQHFVCQLQKGIQITTTPAAPVGSTSPLCVGNGTWYYYNNNCYQMSNGTDSQRTWFDARRYCMANGGDLASIHSREDNGFITSMVSRTWRALQMWVGLNNLDFSGYQWSDGTPVQFLAWHIQQPNDGDGAKRCVYLRNKLGSWFDDNCNDVMGFVCQKRPKFSQPITPPPTARIPGGCPAGFTTSPRSNRCYMVGGKQDSGRLNWTNANNYCKQQAPGANLAIITSNQENMLVTTLIEGVRTQAWIGLQDRKTNGRYMWIDSTEVDFTNWAPGQPNEDITNDKIQHRRDCVMMWHQPLKKPQAGGWDDYFCDYRKAFVCSVSKVRQGYITPTPSTAGCSSGYQRYGNSCYKGVRTPALNWQDAQGACKRDGGNLVSINNMFESAFVGMVIISQGSSWIGLSNLQNPKSFTWIDNYPVQFTNWAFEEPTTASGDGCVMLKWNGKWNNTQCTDTHGYICEIHVGGGPSTTPVVQGYCPDSTWTAGTDYCYKAVGSPSKSWPESRYICQMMGGDLASVGNNAEMVVISNMLQGNTSDVWLGLSKSMDGGFSWTDGSPVSYLNWAPNEPSDSSGQWQQDCVLMMASQTWTWNDLDCFTSAGYICKILKHTTTVATAAPQNQQGQGQGHQTPQTQGPNQGQRTRAPHQGSGNQNTKNPFNNNNPNNFPTAKPINEGGHYTNQYLRNTQNNNKSGGGLSGGGIAGVVLAVIIILALVAVGFIFARRRYNLFPNLPMAFENAAYDKNKDEVSMSSQNPKSQLYNDNEEDC